MTLLAHNLYVIFTKELPGFEKCTSGTIFRKFLDTSANIVIKNHKITIYLKKKTHLPILFETKWMNKEIFLTWLNASIEFKIATTF